MVIIIKRLRELHPCNVQIWVYGNSFESTLLAVCVPNEPALTEWARSNGVEGDFAQICKDPKAEAYIMAAVNATGKAKKVIKSQVVGNVRILRTLPLVLLFSSFLHFF